MFTVGDIDRYIGRRPSRRAPTFQATQVDLFIQHILVVEGYDNYGLVLQANK